jgi:CheY-like chemotaxis protein
MMTVSVSAIILILEDDKAHVEAIETGLNIAAPGCKFRILTTGEAFLQALSDEPPPDFIFLDLMLPDMKGIDVLRRIRRRSDLDWLKIVVLSSDGSAPTQAECLEQGANGFYVKRPLKDMIVLLPQIIEEFGVRNPDKPQRIWPPLVSESAERPAKRKVDDLLKELM